MTDSITNKDFYSWFVANGYTAYGAEVSVDTVREYLGVVRPETGTEKTFSDLALIELGFTDYIRNVLLGEGKYLTCSRGVYRVLLPSENAAQVERYIGSANTKLKRALKLSKHTPAEYKKPNDDTGVRIALKQKSLKEAHLYGNVP